MNSETSDITHLIERWGRGEADALEPLVELTYEELRAIAHRQLRSLGGDPTLETTALVHELYFRLAGVDHGTWGSRARFFAFCAKAMRRILIDFARKRGRAKRGGGWVRVPATDVSGAVDADSRNLLALDSALTELAEHHERMAQVVEYRYFGGLSVVETAEALSTSVRTVEREWTRAKAYLHVALLNDPHTSVMGGEQ